MLRLMMGLLITLALAAFFTILEVLLYVKRRRIKEKPVMVYAIAPETLGEQLAKYDLYLSGKINYNQLHGKD